MATHEPRTVSKDSPVSGNSPTLIIPRDPNNIQYNGPDSSGKWILFIVLIFFLYCYAAYWFSSRVQRDIPFSISSLQQSIEDANSLILGSVFHFPISLYILSAHSNTIIPHKDHIEESFATAIRDVKSNLLYYRTEHQDPVSFEITTTVLSLNHTQLSSLRDISFDKNNAVHQLDEVVSAILPTSSSGLPDSLQYVLILQDSLPAQHHLPSDQFVVGGAAHSSAVIQSTDGLAHLSQQSTVLTSFRTALWSQLQPALLPPTPRTEIFFRSIQSQDTSSMSPKFHEYLSATLSRSSALFESIFHVSLSDFIALRPTLTQTYNVDVTLVNHASLASIAPPTSPSSHSPSSLGVSGQYQLNGTSFTSALGGIISSLAPFTEVNILLNTKHHVPLLEKSDIQAKTLHVKTGGTDAANTEEDVHVLSYAPSWFADISTSKLSRWKTHLELKLPHSEVTPTVLNFVGIVPPFGNYHGMKYPTNVRPTYLAREDVVSQVLSSGHHPDVDVDAITSIWHNQATIPHWGSVCVVPPTHGRSVSPQQQQPNTSLTLADDQQDAMNHYIINRFKLLLGIGIDAPGHSNATSLSIPSTRPIDPRFDPRLVTYRHVTLPLWQYLLYIRSSLWASSELATHMLTSICHVLTEATHMPFPISISHKFHMAVQGLQAVAASIAASSSHDDGVDDSHQHHALAQPQPWDVLLRELSATNKLAKFVFFHEDMLPQLHFPIDQLYAIYAPMFAPMVVPILSSFAKIIVSWIKYKRGARQSQKQ